MNPIELFVLICIIGICTYLIRVVFVYSSPDFIQNYYIQVGLQSVPSSMLIALVIPFLLFTDNGFEPFRIDVLAIILAIPIIHYMKKYQYGLVFALFVFGILKIISLN